ncbi:MAG: LptF/LptG family permease, partial [Muribaculaceae bacterium]
MLKIKRLYKFMLQSYLPLFVMTFFICLFIVLMQFLWRYIDDLVGKGLEISVIGELFFYAALTMVPMALPLAILLASLMTFGNLGERFELTAMKAAGISLMRVMKPLIAFIVLIAIGAFFFQNNVMPIAQSKMYTLLLSMRQKSPELEIPEGVFYDQVTGYNIFVERKNRETGMLYNMMIYDVSHGGDTDKLRIILADSGRMSVTEDKTHLFLRLFSGEQFENLRDQGARRTANVPYRRESFSLKEILIAFDNNFNRMDESGMRSQYVGKNISELKQTIDSVTAHVDSIGFRYGEDLRDYPYFSLPRYTTQVIDGKPERVLRKEVTLEKPVPVDSLMQVCSPATQKSILVQALAKARRQKQEFEYRSYVVTDDYKTIRRHGIEMHRKFTLSIACLIFFFIGAPLGAIIKKGGLGMPLVISVILFIIYYIIDNTGYKMARDGRWEVWEGMWLSTAVLFPLGFFLTKQAINDSEVFNFEGLGSRLRRAFGINEVRHVEMKEIVMEDIVTDDAISRLHSLTDACKDYIAKNKPRQGWFAFWLNGYDRAALDSLADLVDDTVEYFANSKDKLVINKLSDYPILKNIWIYNPTSDRRFSIAALVLFPISLPVWLIGGKYRTELIDELNK